jgi:phage FluMu gp28-like protein
MPMFNARDVFLPYQQTWLQEPAQLAVFEKCRRAGVSWSQAFDDSTYVAAGNGNCWYMGQDKDMSQAYISDVAYWAETIQAAHEQLEPLEILDEDGKAIQVYTVKFASGHKVTALSSRPANLRSKGRPGDKFTFDEAAFHPDFEGLLKAAGALLMWGCQVRIISTHNGEANPFNLLIQDIRAGHIKGAVHRVTFDEAVEQGLYKRICQITRKAWTAQGEAGWIKEIRDFYRHNAAEELDVIPSSGSGVWLTRALIEKCMKPVEVVEVTT